MVELKPVLHGRDHTPGGADPIPGLIIGVGTYQEKVLAEPSLIGYWPLDDADGPAVDYSGSEHDLSESAISPTWGQPGPLADDASATSAEFGVASAPTLPNDALRDLNSPADLYYFDGVDPFTFEIFAYPYTLDTVGTGSGDGAGIMGVWDYPGGSGGGVYLVQATTGKVRMYRAGSFWDSPVALTLNEWVHLALTYDGTTLRLYFDAEQQLAQATTAAHSGSGSLQLATFRVAASGFYRNFDGRLAQAAIYNEALSASALANHLGSGGGSGTPGPPGPTGPAGPAGPTGPGVATGGTINQALVKTSSADYATAWAAQTVEVEY